MTPLCLVVAAAAVAPAAPVPKETDAERTRRVFGETVAPGDDYRFDIRADALRNRSEATDRLRVVVPGSANGLVDRNRIGPRDGRDARTRKVVSGDFVATVRVSCLRTPSSRS